MIRQVGKRLLKPLPKAFNRRAIHPICGPPKYPLTGAEHWYLGGGFLVAIMLLPMWGLYNLPHYVKIHNKVDGEEQEEQN